MSVTIDGIHHISAIVGNVNEAVDFYERILGLRLIKQTVNFDDPYTYHLYFSNEMVDDGTIFTFFSWESGKVGTHGSGQVGRIAFLVGKGHLDFWSQRLMNFGITVEQGKTFSHNSIDFLDNHSLQLSIVESDQETENANLIGFYGAEIWSFKPELTQQFLVGQLDFLPLKDTKSHFVLQAGNSTHYIYIPKQAKERGTWGAGTVHHIAFSIATQEQQKELLNVLFANGYRTTEVKDRKYFKAVYIREVGGVVLEFATQGPGFTVDEDLDELGSQLMLPVQFEAHRQEILGHLIPIERKRTL